LHLLPRRQFWGHAVKIAATLLLAAAPRAPGQRAATRWSLSIQHDVNADLRFDGDRGRILLQGADTVFQSLRGLRLTPGLISFDLALGPYQHFTARRTDSLMSGTVQLRDGSREAWSAVPLPLNSQYWPVPPRVTIRQLVLGSVAGSVTLPGDWLAAMPPAARLDQTLTALADSVGLALPDPADRNTWIRQVLLGFDPAARAATRDLMRRIVSSAAASARLRAQFVSSGYLVLDLHDRALNEARHYQPRFDLADAGRALTALGEGAAAPDSLAVLQAAWRYWSRMHSTPGIHAQVDSLMRANPPSGQALAALLAGYDDALAWWRVSVELLLRESWIDTPSGFRSPRDLVAAFWSGDSVAVPSIVDRLYGEVSAYPMVDEAAIGGRLVQSANGVGAEWLAQAGTRPALDLWRRLNWGDALRVVTGSEHQVVLSPLQQATARPASFFLDHDAVAIDPGIAPILAVAVAMHEWQHLVMARQRLRGTHPAAVVDGATQLALRDDNSWVSEGFAEWSTDRVLAEGGAATALLRFTQAVKRNVILRADSTDPHALGFRLMLGAVPAAGSAARLRDLAAAQLHDIGAIARSLGLDGHQRGPALTLQRPSNASVIPEVTFTWGDGTAVDVSHRLLLPISRPEP
jgi:hypothetical protein